MEKDTSPSTSRRGLIKGAGGLAMLSMSGATLAEAQEAIADQLPSDPHTLDTYRSIVDAILPETPQLEKELGPEHVPGGLAVELERFIIWDFNHFQEIRSESVAPSGAPSPGAPMDRSMFEVDLDIVSAASPLEAVHALGDDGVDPDAVLDGDTRDGIEEHLTFGPVEEFSISFADDGSDDTGIERFERVVVTADQTHHRVLQNYPYASTFAFAFDLAAADFLARGANEDQPGPNDKFPGGGTFVRLSPEDRLRCLWDIVDGGSIDRLDGLLAPMIPEVGLLKFVVMAVNGLHGFGYYTEWSGYGDTKTDAPSERELQVAEGDVQSRQQTGYPGPANGYAADWRHVIDGGFTDEWETDEDEDNTGPPDDVPVDLPPEADDMLGDLL